MECTTVIAARRANRRSSIKIGAHQRTHLAAAEKQGVHQEGMLGFCPHGLELWRTIVELVLCFLLITRLLQLAMRVREIRSAEQAWCSYTRTAQDSAAFKSGYNQTRPNWCERCRGANKNPTHSIIRMSGLALHSKLYDSRSLVSSVSTRRLECCLSRRFSGSSR